MAKRPPGYGSRRPNRDGEPTPLSENNFRYVDQIERWRQEYERYTAVEENLAALSKLSYDPVDYAPLLVQVPWKERPIPDFSFLVEEARVTTESKFFIPIMTRLAGLVLSVIILVLSSNTTFLWVPGALSIVLMLCLFWEIQQRQNAIKLALQDAQKQVETRTEQERQVIENEKKQHELAETERVALVEKLIAGDIAAVFLRIDNVLSRIGLPFPVDVHIDIFENIPLIQILLPPKTVVPLQTCSLLPSGRVKHTDKETRTVNKQYIELCSAIIIQVMSILYGNIPSFDRAYVWGLIKSVPDNECLFDVAVNRDELVKACRAENGITALRQLASQFETDTMLNLKVIEAEKPPEWGNVPQQLLRSMHINLLK